MKPRRTPTHHGRTSYQRTRMRMLVIVIATAVGLMPGIPAAVAADYPTWADVESARSNESAKQAQIDELTALLAALTADVGAARVEHEARAAEYEQAQTAFDQATLAASELQQLAEDAGQRADDSRRQAGRLAANLARTGGSNLTLALFTSPDSADLLRRLSAMTKLTERTDAIYAAARGDANNAEALQSQADVARAELAGLAYQAETALTGALNALSALESRAQEQQTNDAVLRAQLVTLTENRAATEADYRTGEEVRIAAEEEAARKAAEAEAARQAAEAAVPRPVAIPPYSGGGSAAPSGQSWVAPVSGRISSPFGPRPDKPVAGVNPFHYATDLVAGCGVPVAAASSGTVVYSGWLGSYGNWVLLDHGNGVQTGYAHNSTVLVGEGQSVSVGQTIALVGTTGASTGCHSHFETRVGGARVDPESFMDQRGVTLGR